MFRAIFGLLGGGGFIIPLIGIAIVGLSVVAYTVIENAKQVGALNVEVHRFAGIAKNEKEIKDKVIKDAKDLSTLQAHSLTTLARLRAENQDLRDKFQDLQANLPDNTNITLCPRNCLIQIPSQKPKIEDE